MKKPTPLKVAIFHSGRLQKDIAAEIGMDEGQFSRHVNGLHADEATRDRIAEALGKTVDELWPDAGDQVAA